MNPRVLEMAGRLTLCGVPEGADALIIAEVARARAVATSYEEALGVRIELDALAVQADLLALAASLAK